MSARDITAEQFSTDVIEASRHRPVVVDFWAPWCGPCHQLSPLLEKVAERHAAEVDTVKLNVDTAPQIAQQFQVQGIPAVKAFKDGMVAGEFVGVQPEPAIEALFAAVRDPETREEGRTAVLTVFDVLGGDDELVRTWRPRLAAALF